MKLSAIFNQILICLDIRSIIRKSSKFSQNCFFLKNVLFETVVINWNKSEIFVVPCQINTENNLPWIIFAEISKNKVIITERYETKMPNVSVYQMCCRCSVTQNLVIVTLRTFWISVCTWCYFDFGLQLMLI